MGILKLLLIFVRGFFANRAELSAENLALRQQLAVLQRSAKRPKLRQRDRIFWVWLSRFSVGWRCWLVLVKPDTVIRWHRQGFRLYWRWLSRRKKPGRPRVDAEIRDLIRRMCRENPTWGAPRILSELNLLGYKISERTVAKYMVRVSKPPSQTWRTFLKNHASDIAATDFFTVPTVTFRILFCLVIMRHDRRRVLHFNLTTRPTAQWTAQQIAEAFPWDEAPKYLIRDRDAIYGEYFTKRVKRMSIQEVLIAPRSPWQNPYCERLIGSIRRECLDHMIVLGQAHLRHILTLYFKYYHASRPHLSLARNAPVPRLIEPCKWGDIVSIPEVGGLHHRYTRAA